MPPLAETTTIKIYWNKVKNIKKSKSEQERDADGKKHGNKSLTLG
jgi:hypothetical protein